MTWSLWRLAIRWVDLTKLQRWWSASPAVLWQLCLPKLFSVAYKLWRQMIYGGASSWPIVIICLEWKFGCSLISSGGPLFGILTALCLEMRLHFWQSGTFIFPNSHRAASPLCVGRWPFFPEQSHLISTSGGTMSGRHVHSHYPEPFINVL